MYPADPEVQPSTTTSAAESRVKTGGARVPERRLTADPDGPPVDPQLGRDLMRAVEIVERLTCDDDLGSDGEVDVALSIPESDVTTLAVRVRQAARALNGIASRIEARI